MMAMRTLLLVMVVAGCSTDSGQPVCPEIEFSCDVAVDCGGVMSHVPATICSNSTDPGELGNAANSQAKLSVSCTAAATYTATCEAPPSAFVCPGAFYLETGTVCVDTEKYDSPNIADVCEHLPPNDGSQSPACSVACDSEAMRSFILDGEATIAGQCVSTDGIDFFAIARP